MSHHYEIIMPSFARPVCVRSVRLVALCCTAALLGAAAAGMQPEPVVNAAPLSPAALIDPADETILYFPQGERASQRELEALLNATASPQRLREWHDLTSSEPHVAGTPGDERLVNRLVAAFEEMGLKVDKQPLDLYLARPVSASLQIVSEPQPIDLPLIERPLDEDPFTKHPDLTFGWNAYSGSGDVTAGVVYANYGTKDDFALLREMGVDCAGKIVLARYGGNFRGYKAKFAQEAGAAGLLIYSDPADSGFARGPVYPEGGYANETYIQRGSILTLDYAGDPLTPFEPSVEGMETQRLDPSKVALPTIPVQPIGWGAAQEIMARMTGDASTLPPPWRGAMPVEYRVAGGDELKVRLKVEQERVVTRTWNVVARITGTTHPSQKVIVGAHHDAWSFGAGDPNCGTVAVLEIARCFAEAARQGLVPQRSIYFACWGAEEFGILGSTEWVESRLDDLHSNGVAYFNLDMASMGPQFGAAAAPLLKRAIIDATRYVPQPPPVGAAPGGATTMPQPESAAVTRTVYEDWLKRSQAATTTDEPSFGDLGGGSDHVAFYCHVGIPSAGLGGSGAPGVSYHSNYETLAWYRKVVGEDYASPLMVTRVANILVSRFANAAMLPYDAARPARDLEKHLQALTTRARQTGVFPEDEPQSTRFPGLPARFDDLVRAAKVFTAKVDYVEPRLRSEFVLSGLPMDRYAPIARILMGLEHDWVRSVGLPGRPWYRHWYASPDPDSGYGAWMLPGLRHAVEAGDEAALASALRWYEGAFNVLNDRYTHLTDYLEALNAAYGQGQGR